MKKRILFLCMHNSARSQMAEALVNAYYGDRYRAFSAGSNPSGINPFTIKVMSEIGIDISRHYSKDLQEFRSWFFDYVVTVCEQAKKSCPFFPHAQNYLDISFTDPAATTGGYEDKIKMFRQVREDIKLWLEDTFGETTKDISVDL